MDKFVGNFQECLQLVYNMPKSETNDVIIASIVEKFGQQFSEILKQTPEYLTGVVTYYRGTFGFVKSGGKKYFIHMSNIKANVKRPYLRPGEKVKFTVGVSPWSTDMNGKIITERVIFLSAVDGKTLKCDKKQIKRYSEEELAKIRYYEKMYNVKLI